MSYTYRERDREWDEYSRPSDRSSYKVKRYVVPSEDSYGRDRDFYRRDDPGMGERELVIRRRTEPNEVDYDVRREYREHEPRGIYEPDYQVVHRSEAVDRDPRDVEYYYQRRVREYDDDRIRREISPHDSVSQVSTRRRHDRDRDDYSSDDSMVYIRKETRDYDDGGAHYKRHLAEGALVGVGAAELLRRRSKSQGRQVSGGIGRVGKDVGAAALGAVAANAIDHYRSKSRRRASSLDEDERPYHHRRRRSRSRSRSSSHSRAKTLAGIGLGAAAIAGAVALARNSSQGNNDRRSRSRHRRSSRSRGVDVSRSPSKNRNKHMAAAGIAGATAAGIIERVRSQSRSRKGDHRSRSRVRQALPIVAAGLGSAAAAGIYENYKNNHEQSVKGERRRSRSASRSVSRGPILPDPAKESAGLIEYGHDPVYGNIPSADYYGRPASQQGYYNDATTPGGRRSRDISRSRGYDSSSSGSDHSHRRRHRRRENKERSSSRIRDLAEAGLAAAGLGYAAKKFSNKKDKKDRGHRSRERESRHRDDERDTDSYEEPYDPAPYTPPPAAAGPPPADNYYPYTNSFPPPPGPSPNPQPASYNPTEYPPASGPPPVHGYPPPPGAPPGNEPYAPQPRRADENVSVPFLDDPHAADGVRGLSQPPSIGSREGNSRRRSTSQPEPSYSKSVSFDLGDKVSPGRNINEGKLHNTGGGYETDDSDSTLDGYDRGRHHHHHRTHANGHESNSYQPTSNLENQQHRSHHHKTSRSVPPAAKDDDSESTIDLPDRFDSQGRRLPEEGDDPFADTVENFLQSVFSSGRSRARSRA